MIYWYGPTLIAALIHVTKQLTHVRALDGSTTDGDGALGRAGYDCNAENGNLEILLSVGGIGLFLLGMVILTEGLRNVVGNSLRRLMSRYTRTPARGAAIGALVTAMVQSSSATTVTVVGFVGAGILTFSQGLGIVFGANVGTTATGWMVALLGFKFPLGEIAIVFVFAGVLLRLFGRKKLRHVGWALAGFGVLFVGIGAMQDGMARFEAMVTPQDFPIDSFVGRLQLVAMGALVTLVTQSSSVGVAAALVALNAGSISFPQAAALVIGMDIGTTFTAALATVGGSVAMRRTGYAHVIYNIMTGTMAFFLLGPFTAVIVPLITDGGQADNGNIALVAFHTAFNALGVLLILPIAQPFANLVIRLVPESGEPLLQRLDTRLLREPAAAADAAAATIGDIATRLTGILADLLNPVTRDDVESARLVGVTDALTITQEFVEQIRVKPTDVAVYRRHLASMHALDHLHRLARRCMQETRIAALDSEPRLRRLRNLLRDTATEIATARDRTDHEDRLDRLRSLFRSQRRRYRDQMVQVAARHEISTDVALQRLDSMRWLHRTAYHLWRILHHLCRAETEKPAQPQSEERLVDAEED